MKKFFYLIPFLLVAISANGFARNTFEESLKQQTPFVDKVDVIPNAIQTRLDYTGGPTASDPVYVGYAVRGKAASADVWRIQKLTYTGGVVTLIQTADCVWDNRASSCTYA